MNIGDQSRFHLAIDNVEGETGDYVVEVDAKGPVVLPAAATRQTFRLAKGARTNVSLPVAGAGVGTASFTISITGPGVSAAQDLSLRIQPSLHTIARRTVRPIEAGGSITLSGDIFADLVPGSGRVAASVSPLAGLDVPAILKALDRYPYGCTEQTVSRALPLLYVNRLASMEHLGLDGSVDERVAAAVERVLTRQGSNGSFGLWGRAGTTSGSTPSWATSLHAPARTGRPFRRKPSTRRWTACATRSQTPASSERKKDRRWPTPSTFWPGTAGR